MIATTTSDRIGSLPVGRSRLRSIPPTPTVPHKGGGSTDVFRFIAAVCLALGTVSVVIGQAPSALPKIAAVDYDERGAFRVNAKPFFPIGLYDAPVDERTLRELRGFGFNVLVCDAKACAGLPAKGFYGMVHTDKKIDDLSGVFMGVGADSPALIFRKNLLKQVAEANAKTRSAVPGRPIMNAIGYWPDEPKGVVKGVLPSKALYEDLVAAIDVSGPYLYPIPYQPVSSVGDAVARARIASGGKKPIIAILQLFVWDAKDRYPTPAELRCMAFLALVEGSHGIGYYSYGSINGRPKTNIAEVQPELWKSVRKLNHDIADIGPRLLAGAASSDLTLAKDTLAVKMKVVREQSASLAVLVNSAATSQAVKLMAQPGFRGQLTSHDGKRLTIKDGAATLMLEPFGVAIIHVNQPS